MQKPGHIRAEIKGHGTYETTFTSFEAVQELYAGDTLRTLYRYIEEGHGQPGYITKGLTRTECLMILQELRGHATN